MANSYLSLFIGIKFMIVVNIVLHMLWASMFPYFGRIDGKLDVPTYNDNKEKVSVINNDIEEQKMSVKIEENHEEKMEEPVTTIKQKCAKCVKGPNLIKTLVVVACLAVVIQQITVCISKLVDVPITTYTHFDFNKTIQYPSVTFCREPPYKFDKMLEYGLYGHPRFTSVWIRFNFTATTLDKLWEDITYTEEEFFSQYGLNHSPDNVEVTETIGFVHGRCYTISPKNSSTRASKVTGYSISLQHSSKDVATSISEFPPGYHIYVHYTREPFTEVEVYNGGLVDYLYINTGETMDVKLTVDQYNMLSDEDNPCTQDSGYSANYCTSKYVSETVAEEVGCSGPWMISDLPRCDNYDDIKGLISAYSNLHLNHHCVVCPRFCQAFLYNAMVTDRQTLYMWDNAHQMWSMKTGAAALQSQVYMHFNSMMVSVYEERYNYDWNLFISDLGGSIGFLLGLSVISLMTIFGKIWSTMIRPFIRTPKIKKDAVSISSAETVDVKNDPALGKTQEAFKKCNEWNYEK